MNNTTKLYFITLLFCAFYFGAQANPDKNSLAPQSDYALNPDLPRVKNGDKEYVIAGELGHGTQGQVLDAYDLSGKKWVAIKKIQIQGSSIDALKLADREAFTLPNINHNNAPHYIELFEKDGSLYLVMEKIEGTPVSKLLKSGPLDTADVLHFIKDATDLLTYLAGEDLVHRDIKPSNVIKRPDGTYAVVDFGSVTSKLVNKDGGSTVAGTFAYMPPEQLYGKASTRSDVYGVGMTALSMLTSMDAEDFIRDENHQVNVMETLKHNNIKVSASLITLLQRMVAYSTEKRPWPKEFETELANIPEIRQTPGLLSAGQQGQLSQSLFPQLSPLATSELTQRESASEIEADGHKAALSRPNLPARLYKRQLIRWFSRNPVVHGYLDKVHNETDIGFFEYEKFQDVLRDKKVLPILDHLIRSAYDVTPKWTGFSEAIKFDHGEPVIAAKLSPNERYAVTVSQMHIKIWDVRSGVLIRDIPCFDSQLVTMAMHPEKNIIIVGTTKNTSMIDLETGKVAYQWGIGQFYNNEHYGDVLTSSIAFSNSGDRAAFYTPQGQLTIINLATKERVSYDLNEFNLSEWKDKGDKNETVKSKITTWTWDDKEILIHSRVSRYAYGDEGDGVYSYDDYAVFVNSDNGAKRSNALFEKEGRDYDLFGLRAMLPLANNKYLFIRSDGVLSILDSIEQSLDNPPSVRNISFSSLSAIPNDPGHYFVTSGKRVYRFAYPSCGLTAVGKMEESINLDSLSKNGRFLTIKGKKISLFQPDAEIGPISTSDLLTQQWEEEQIQKTLDIDQAIKTFRKFFLDPAFLTSLLKNAGDNKSYVLSALNDVLDSFAEQMRSNPEIIKSTSSDSIIEYRNMLADFFLSAAEIFGKKDSVGYYHLLGKFIASSRPDHDQVVAFAKGIAGDSTLRQALPEDPRITTMFSAPSAQSDQPGSVSPVDSAS